MKLSLGSRSVNVGMIYECMYKLNSLIFYQSFLSLVKMLLKTVINVHVSIHSIPYYRLSPDEL